MDLRNIFGLFNVKPFAHAAIAQVTTPGTTVLVTGVTGKVIYVYAYKFTVHAAGTAKFQSKPSGTAVDIDGAMTLDANGGMCEQDPRYLFKCPSGSSLQITTATGAANGRVSYWIE